MKQIVLSHPYKVSTPARKNLPRDIDVSKFLIDLCIGRRYPNGMPRTDSKIWARLSEKLDGILEDSLSIEELEFMWLYERMEKWEEIPYDIARWYWTFMNHLEEVKRGE